MKNQPRYKGKWESPNAEPFDKKIIGLRVTPTMRAAVKEKAIALGIEESEVIRRAIASYLEQGELLGGS